MTSKGVLSSLESMCSHTQNLKQLTISILFKNLEMEVLALCTMFINEVQILTCLRHRNLVSLYGCTSRHSHELLVYEYIPNGTVADHLHGDRAKNASLTWPVRMNIAIETANALTYLHASDIIHRDIKTTNILLDNNFCVKVADFGLSRLFPTHVTHVSTAPQGTPGYVDPEYHRCYQLTDKSNVYSFGVVLIELISSLIQNRAFDELIDPFLGFDSDSLIERMTTLVAELAFQCLQREKEMRPTMDEVLEALKEIQEYKYDTIGEEIDTVGVLNCTQPPPSPESDDVVLLKNIKAAVSLVSVTDRSLSLFLSAFGGNGSSFVEETAGVGLQSRMVVNACEGINQQILNAEQLINEVSEEKEETVNGYMRSLSGDGPDKGGIELEVKLVGLTNGPIESRSPSEWAWITQCLWVKTSGLIHHLFNPLLS
ncbi:hypothetical protein TEA_006973 [Camellia sinensis var. sinensis]|uniref:Protein kinase domain-containing protein n=1 Tax=Camellia sinensis var. sinensis TaxID=542762 RepID=A0A4S4EA29_CAMSN|nr:hypothetical protein TEA_006973 [Camellia sinensis var. sinensis]